MIKLEWNGEKYVVRLSFDERERVKSAQFLWDEELKRYATSDPRIAYRLIDFADEATQKKIKKSLGLEHKKYDASKIDWPWDKTPYAHQIEFVHHVLARRASYIAGEPGTGKTPAAIMCMNADPGDTLIICPAFLRYNWELEIKEWAVRSHNIDVIRGEGHAVNLKADVIIYPASFMHVEKIRKQVLSKKYKLIIVDEADYFTNPKAKRTVSLFGGELKQGREKIKWSGFHKITERIVDMSGTPMPNRPMELYPVLASHAPHVIEYMDQHSFGVKYCGGYYSQWGWDYSGASNQSEMHKNLTRDFMIVKKLEECVDLPKKIPPKFIYLDDDRGELAQDEMKILSRLKIKDIILSEMEQSGFFDMKRQLGPVDNGFQYVSELRKKLGLRKVPQAVKVIKEILDHEPVIVFAWHKDVVAELAEGLSKFDPFVVTGQTSEKKRNEFVKEFQTSKKRNLFIANIKAAGVGITLTKAAYVIFVEPSWVPGQNDQATNRAYRITQTRQVRSAFLVWRNSLDHLILNAHQDKNENIKTILHGKG